MLTAARSQSGDPALAPFLDAPDERSASQELDRLLDGRVDRLVRETVRRALGDFGARGPMDGADADDLAGDVRLRLVRRLWLLRDGIGDPIDNFAGYAVAAAENVCYGFLRQRHPDRTRFRNRVRYAVAHHPETRLEQDGDGLWLCRSRLESRRTPQPGTTLAFVNAPATTIARLRLDTAAPLAALVRDLLAAFDTSIPLDQLVDGLAAVLGISDLRPAAVREPENGLAAIVDPAPGIGEVLEHRESLRRVWDEIVELPIRQRTALLLNLRDPQGGAVLHLLPATGVVTFSEIATALGTPVAALERLWSGLPLDDLALAARLGLTRQQVINLRKAARARLARRLGGSLER